MLSDSERDYVEYLEEEAEGCDRKALSIKDQIESKKLEIERLSKMAATWAKCAFQLRKMKKDKDDSSK